MRDEFIPVDCMSFIFRHPLTNEQKIVYLSRAQIQDSMTEAILDELCDCDSTGAKECGCFERYEDFELV